MIFELAWFISLLVLFRHTRRRPGWTASAMLLLGYTGAYGYGLPQDVAMNADAGQRGQLNLVIRLADGQRLPVLVDTGANATVLDRSIEPKPGKRLGKGQAAGWAGNEDLVSQYAAPKLYLGNVRLMTGRRVWVADLKRPSGILGMDCLQHYCIQLDFQARTVRFLNPNRLDKANLGDPFPLIFKNNLPYIRHANFVNDPASNILIDLGCHIDAMEGTNAFNGLGEFMPQCLWNVPFLHSFLPHSTACPIGGRAMDLDR